MTPVPEGTSPFYPRALTNASPVTYRCGTPFGVYQGYENHAPMIQVRSSAGTKGLGKREIPEKTRLPVASSGMIPICEDPGVARPGIEPGAPLWEASRLTAHTLASQVQFPAGSPDFRKWESCQMMPLVGGLSRGSPVSPVPSFRRCSIFISITLNGSQDLAVKSRPILFTHSLYSCVGQGRTPMDRGYRVSCTTMSLSCVASFSEVEVLQSCVETIKKVSTFILGNSVPR
ncbi:hypothetical protein PR048_012339 [Dryococelus australis]|uniref:Uncharacterized protein n=1 Tax=Dryococelus australis TaxID=614101 RepID=A0ABQ9HPB5_9NEOP|nr:hypothetical protein PR048_012339 [Dryococelus australis]